MTRQDEPPNGSSNDLQTDPSISWPVNRPASRSAWTPKVDKEIRLREQASAAATPTVGPNFALSSRDLFPGQPRSLSGVATRAFLLGQALGLSIAGTLYLAFVRPAPLFRAPLFVAVLALFHFLEFWTTARFNTPVAKTAAFLLTNGKEYQIAHLTALLEHLITRFLFPGVQDRVIAGGYTLVVGVALIALGQVVRSIAMAQAGTNFNHQVQSKRNEGHELVTDGMYASLRHPSYFGFFWWGLGTQLMLGNVICLGIYAFVLWRFFSRRIMHEEKFLISFFGDEYVQYRARTKVGIPFIP